MRRISILIGALFSISTSVFAYDPTRFLVDSSPKSAPDKYLIHPGDSASAYSNILLSILRSATGIQHNPIYPIILPQGPSAISLVTSSPETGSKEELIEEFILASFISDQSLQDYFKSKVVEDFSEDFFSNLNLFLTRLEAIDLEKLHDLIGALEINTSKEIFSKLVWKQKQLRQHLINIYGSSAQILQKPANIETPFLEIPSTLSVEPIEKIWKIFLESSESKRNALIASSGTDFSGLQKLARDQARLFYGVYSNRSINWVDPKSDDPVQLTLNSLNSETLVVVPMNDNEASLIRTIAIAAGAHVLPIQGNHGIKLTGAIAESVEREAGRIKAKRVFVIEIPPAKGDSIEDELRAKIPHFEVIDHHNYGGNLDRYFYRSSLEQIADFLGYQLGRSSRAVGIMDANYIWGLRDFGISKVEMQSIIKAADSVTLKDGFKQTAYGPFVMIYGDPTPISKLAISITQLTWPDIPNILMFDGSHTHGEFRVSGRADFVQALFEIWQRHSNKLNQPPYIGGDPMRSRFAGIKQIPGDIWPSVRDETLAFIEKTTQKLESPPKPASVLQSLWLACKNWSR